MVLPLYSALEKMDYTLIEAANDLGCPPFSAFWKITFPLSLPGVVAGCMLVFIPAVGEFVIPDLLGGTETLMIGKVLWNEFNANRDWPVSSAVAVILLAVAGRADHDVPALSGQGAGGRDDEPDLVPLQHRLDRARFCVPLSADRHSGDLLLQRLQAGDGVGRLFDPVVRVAIPQPGALLTPPG
jgi:hypothetical protein